MNNEEMNSLTELGFVFPTNQNTAVLQTGAGRFIVNRFSDMRWQVSLSFGPGRRNKVWKAGTFERLMVHLVRLLP